MRTYSKNHVTLMLCAVSIAWMMSLSGCAKFWKPTPKIKTPVYLDKYWGTKAECVKFLQSDEAGAGRWFMQAMD